MAHGAVVLKQTLAVSRVTGHGRRRFRRRQCAQVSEYRPNLGIRYPPRRRWRHGRAGQPLPHDAKDYLYFRVDRRRKMPVTILLKALGYNNEQILKEFFLFDTFHLTRDTIEFELVPERMRGETARFDITTKAGKTIVAKDKRITVRHVREMEQDADAG